MSSKKKRHGDFNARAAFEHGRHDAEQQKTLFKIIILSFLDAYGTVDAFSAAIWRRHRLPSLGGKG